MPRSTARRGPLPLREFLPEHDSQSDLARKLGVSRQRVSQLLNREKHLARVIVAQALRKGKVVKPERCQCCNTKTSILHAHHHDYKRRLDVKWLCRKCHYDCHRTK